MQHPNLQQPNFKHLRQSVDMRHTDTIFAQPTYEISAILWVV